MTFQELAVIKEHNLPIKVIVLNNNSLGMVRQWQELFYEKRYSHSVFQTQPDFIKLAEAFGIKGVRIQNHQNLKTVLEKSFANREPELIEIVVAPEENVYPMIAPGKGLNEMVGIKK